MVEPKFTPSGYKWKPKSPIGNVNTNVSMPLGNESRTANILEPMTPRCSTMSNTLLSSNSFATHRDNSIHCRLWVLKAHDRKSQASNLFSVGEFCDADLEVAFRKSTCYIRDLKGNDLLTCSCGSDLYSITLQDTSTPNPICLLAKASSPQAWLWHRRLSHLNFDTVNLLLKYDILTGLLKLKFVKDHLCSSCELGKSKQKSFHIKTTPSSKRRLQLLHMDLCGPMRVESINGKKYVLVIVDDYSRYTWTHFLRQRQFLNKTLHVYFAQEGIEHKTLTARTPEQNGVVERRNRTLVEAARTMLSSGKVPLFFWAEAIATACFTQNRSLVIPRYEKTPYHIINGQKPSVKFFHIFGFLSYNVRDGENLDKMKEKAETVTTSNELDFLFSLMFDELLNGTTLVVSKSSAVDAADTPNKRQQQNITSSTTITAASNLPPLTIQKIPETTNQAPTQAPTVTSDKNINQAETHIHQSPRGTFINQAKYAQEILKKHGMISCDSIGTPMATKYLDADVSGTPVDQTKYRSMVGALMYLTASRPDTVHATCYCARYQAGSTKKHLTAVKRIFRYLKNTINIGLWYSKDTGFELTAFSDSDHAGCLDSRKSTSGGIQFLGGDKLVSWSSKKQDCTLMSSAEAEYVSLSA
ncbi:retrovirus-related pol polyprotein from transposon TNT 1-94 [Tanacetum coccineum]